MADPITLSLEDIRRQRIAKRKTSIQTQAEIRTNLQPEQPQNEFLNLEKDKDVLQHLMETVEGKNFLGKILNVASPVTRFLNPDSIESKAMDKAQLFFEPFAEAGTAATYQAKRSVTQGRSPFSTDPGSREAKTFGTIKDILTGETGPAAGAGKLREIHGTRNIAEQIVFGAIFDPLNVVPFGAISKGRLGIKAARLAEKAGVQVAHASTNLNLSPQTVKEVRRIQQRRVAVAGGSGTEPLDIA